MSEDDPRLNSQLANLLGDENSSDDLETPAAPKSVFSSSKRKLRPISNNQDAEREARAFWGVES